MTASSTQLSCSVSPKVPPDQERIPQRCCSSPHSGHTDTPSPAGAWQRLLAFGHKHEERSARLPARMAPRTSPAPPANVWGRGGRAGVGGRAQPQSPQSGAPRSGRCSRGSSRPQPNLGTAPELSRAGRAPPMARLSGQPAGTMEHSCCCWVLNVTKGYCWAWGGEGARVRDHSGGSGSVGGAVPVTPLHPQAPAACVHPSAHNKPPPLRGLPRAWHGMSRKSVLKRPLSSHCA